MNDSCLASHMESEKKFDSGKRYIFEINGKIIIFLKKRSISINLIYFYFSNYYRKKLQLMVFVRILCN